MDATIIVNSKEEFDKLYDDIEKDQSDLLAFTFGKDIEGFPYHHFIESWFLIAPKENEVINDWLEEFIKAIDIGFDTYVKEVKKTTKISDSLDGWGSYLTIHITLQSILQKRSGETYKKPIITLKRSEDTMYKIQTLCKNVNKCLQDFINEKPEETISIPFIKLNGDNIRNINVDYKKLLNL
jgi:hypothetical protein